MKHLLLSLIVLSFFSAHAKSLKISTLAPEGTTWANNLKKMVKEIKKATNKKVKFKVYYGGAQGDEPDILRKIRIYCVYSESHQSFPVLPIVCITRISYLSKLQTKGSVH